MDEKVDAQMRKVLDLIDEASKAKWPTQRNVVITQFRQLGAKAMYYLLLSNDFQVGLDSIDPDSPRYIKEEAIRNIIVIGLLHMIDCANELISMGFEIKV